MSGKKSKLDNLKIKALRLSKSIKGAMREESTAPFVVELLARVALLPEYKAFSPAQIHQRLFQVDLKKCMQIIALEQGVSDWSVLKKNNTNEKGLLDNDDSLVYRYDINDRGLNVWYAKYEEAKHYQLTRKGLFLFPYKNSFFVCQSSHIEDLGLDPKDKDWDRIERDWVKPADSNAKLRLKKKLINAYAKKIT